METRVKIDVNTIIMCGAKFNKEIVQKVVDEIERMKYTAIINIAVIDAFTIPSDVLFKVYTIIRKYPTYFVLKYDDDFLGKLLNDLRDMFDHKVSFYKLDEHEIEYYKHIIGCLH